MSENKNPDKIKHLFNTLSSRYDRLNNLISLGRHKIIKKEALKKLKLIKDFKVLDLCTGTGDIPFILNKLNPKLEIMGVDFSSKMIEIATQKNSFKNINFFEADVQNLPFVDNYFDIITISFGLRNTDNIDTTLDEIKRVIKPDGQLLILDLGKPKSRLKPFVDFYFKRIILFIAKIFNKNKKPFEYLYSSNEDFPDQEELREKLGDKGFKNISTYDYLFGNIQLQITKGLR